MPLDADEKRIIRHFHRLDQAAVSYTHLDVYKRQQIGFCALVGEEPLEERDLFISPASRYFFGLEYVTVFQVLAYRMADDRGRDLHRGVNAVVSKYITKTL